VARGGESRSRGKGAGTGMAGSTLARGCAGEVVIHTQSLRATLTELHRPGDSHLNAVTDKSIDGRSRKSYPRGDEKFLPKKRSENPCIEMKRVTESPTSRTKLQPLHGPPVLSSTTTSCYTPARPQNFKIWQHIVCESEDLQQVMIPLPSTSRTRTTLKA
jgi:hypothetical protein